MLATNILWMGRHPEGLHPAQPSSPPSASSSSSLLKQSVGGAVNNVATRKINCVQAAGLGGAFWGPVGQKRPGLVIFQAGQEMRLDFTVVQKSRRVDQIERSSVTQRLAGSSQLYYGQCYNN